MAATGQRAGRETPIRVGVVGVGRGRSFAAGATESVGMKLVALCDTWEERLREAGSRYGVATYTDYERFYRGVAMAAVGILGWRSCLQDGMPFRIPDFRDEAERSAFAEDHWSPFPADAGPGQPPPSIRGLVEPSPEAAAYARAQWAKHGYQGE